MFHPIVVIDDKLTLLSQLLQNQAKVISLPATAITQAQLLSLNANALLCRTVTPVNANLLQGTTIEFVASASSGIDHLDLTALQALKIRWAHAPGCNATAVTEYVLACIAALQADAVLATKIKVGIIGAGNVGSEVVTVLRLLDYDVLVNDPPRAQRESDFVSTPLQQFNDCDLICIHCELTHMGEHPSFHLINRNTLAQFKPGSVILNAARGAVVNSQDMLDYGQDLVKCFDVWEHEPDIDPMLLQQCVIATPHIAGYSHDSKQRAAFQVYQALCQYFDISSDVPVSDNNNETRYDLINWQQKLLTVADPRPLTHQFKTAILASSTIPETFLQFRNNYPLRRRILSA